MLFWHIILMQQQRKQQYSIVYSQTYQRFKVQLQIINKIVTNQLWVGKNTFPTSLIYQISKFVFNNPIKLRESIYSNYNSRKLRISEKYLLKLSNELPIDDKVESTQRSKQRSAFLTISKQWRALDVSHCNYAQVISKGKLFFNFISNIKIKVNQPQLPEIDFITNYDAFQRNEKEKNKYFTLISQNKNIVLRQFDQILQYQKDKKINEVVVRSFVSLMGKNMVVVKIDTNYYTQTTGSQGKYLYIQNKSQLPLTTENQTKDYNRLWLYVENGEWRLGNRKEICVYKQQGYPLSRAKKWLNNKRLDYYIQDDVWIRKND